MQFLLVQILHDFPDILGAFAGGDQQSVFRLHHNQIIDAERRNKFSRRVNVISLSVEREDPAPAIRLSSWGRVLPT